MLLVGLFAYLRSLPPEAYFEKPRQHFQEQTVRFHEKIIRKNGMETFWTFDDPECRSASGEMSYTPEVKAVAGARGMGRSFSGKDSSWMLTDHVWKMPDDVAYTIAFRAKVHRLPVGQDVFCVRDANGDCGFQVVDSRLCFRYQTKEKSITVFCPFDDCFDRFVHIAIVSNPKQRQMALYVDGKPEAVRPMATEVLPRLWQIAFGRAELTRDRKPFHGILDDVGIWNRSLGHGEIRKLANSPHGIDRTLAQGSSWLQWKFRQIRLSWTEAVGHFVYGPMSPADIPRALRASRLEKGLPTLSLVLSEADSRHLARAHARSRASGFRTEAAAHPVNAFCHFGGQTLPCSASLAGGTLYYPYQARPGYVLHSRTPGEELLDGMTRLEILPPESSGWLVSLMQSGVWSSFPDLGASRCQLVRFRINGLDQGVFLVRDASRANVVPGENTATLAYLPNKQLNRQRAAEVLRLSPDSLSERTRQLLGIQGDASSLGTLDEQLRTWAEILWNDNRSPLPRAVREKELKQSLLSWKQERDAPFPPAEKALLDEFLLLGRNVSPDRLTEDLDLSSYRALLPSGWSLSLESQEADLMDSEGRLLKRPEQGPARIHATATLTDAKGTTSQRTLSFRVMPENGPVPSLFVWTRERISKSHRTDAMLELYEDAAGNSPQWKMSATASGGGGIKYRGNSSFDEGKRLVNLKTDAPHHWFGESPTPSLLAINAASDFLRVWDTMAFDAYRAFPRPDGRKNIAPHVRLVEMFVNGRYWGPIEFCERVDANLLGDTTGKCIVYRWETAFPRKPYMKPVYPAPVKGDFRKPRLDTEPFLARNRTDDAWYRRIEQGIDLLSVADLHILFTFFGNPNGNPHRYWFMECLVYDTEERRFSYVPWDFDCCLYEKPIGFVHSDLTRKLLSESPAFRKLLADRWAELRAGPLSEETLLGQYDEQVARNLPYLRFEFERWSKFRPAIPIEEYAVKKRATLQARYQQMDEIIRDVTTRAP